MTKGLMLPVSGAPIDVEFDGFGDIYGLIGCEMVESAPYVFDNHPMCLVDEEGLYRQRPNRAIYMGDRLATVLYGNMVFCGSDEESGELADITQRERDMVISRFMVGREGVGSGARTQAELLQEEKRRRWYGILGDAMKSKEGLRRDGKL